MTTQKVTLHVYRDLSNRVIGEPDDGPMAWSAHRERLQVLKETLADPAFNVPKWGIAEDEIRPHELAEFVVEIVKNPTVQTALISAAIYAGKIIAKQIDKPVGRGVEKIFDRLFSAFKDKRIGDFWITLPDGSSIQVSANSEVCITIKDGKPIEYHVDSPPDG